MIKPMFTTTVIEETPLNDEAGASGMYYKIALEPLDQGFGNTLGNALRRVLLNSIQGAAITKVKIKGVTHQFTILEGMSEDIVEFILNVKNIRLSLTDGDKAVLKLSAKGPGVVTAKDIETPGNVTIANPELKLATLAAKQSKLEVELEVKSGTGYVMAETSPDLSLGEIPIDAQFSPITRVSYKVEATRVGRRTDFDKLILEISTDGTIEGPAALNHASEVLVDHFSQIYKPLEGQPSEEGGEPISSDDESATLTVEELDIPTRIANALRKGGYKTVGDLTRAAKADVAQVKNLGDKSVTVVARALKKKGVAFKS